MKHYTQNEIYVNIRISIYTITLRWVLLMQQTSNIKPPVYATLFIRSCVLLRNTVIFWVGLMSLVAGVSTIASTVWAVIVTDIHTHASVGLFFGHLPLTLLLLQSVIFTVAYVLYHITFPWMIDKLTSEAKVHGFCGVESDVCPLGGCSRDILDYQPFLDAKRVFTEDVNISDDK